MEEKDFMEMAIRLSEKSISTNEGGPFGCVIVKDGKVVGQGWNRVTSTNDPTAHAEVVAIRDACKNLSSFQLEDCEIYTSCEPCPMCLGAIYWARPKKVYYASTHEDAANAGFDDSFIYTEINKEVQHRRIPMVQLEREKAKLVFEAWKGKEGKVEY